MTEIPEHLLKRARDAVEKTKAQMRNPALIEYEGDLLLANVDVIAHQTNCWSKNAAGLAPLIFKRCPAANTYGENPEPRRYGTAKLFECNDEEFRYVANLWAQVQPGAATWGLDSPARRLWALRTAIEDMCTQMRGINLTSVAFPRFIGCGLAGGNWPEYLAMLRGAAMSNSDIEFHIVEKK